MSPRVARSRSLGDARSSREAPGSELVGLTYAGPFDELPVAAGVEHRGHRLGARSRTRRAPASSTSRRAAGRRTSRCRKEHGLAVLDPIDEFGVFREGYGWQTGRFAGATARPDGRHRARRRRRPRAKGLLVAREQYAHRYPVCWRCGTQLLFRLVDEWFIAMDPLRAAARAPSTREITWLPPGSASRSASSTGCGTWATG